MMSSVASRWNEFFHSRITTGRNSNAFQLVRYLRIAYGACILFDRFMLSLDFDMFFLYPTSKHAAVLIATLPLIPCQQYFLPVSEVLTNPRMVKTHLPYSPLCSLAAFLPMSYHTYLFYSFHILGIVSAILLIMNVYPKVQLVLLHLNMMSFHFHSYVIWDGEDIFFKVWNFLFLFFPLKSPSSKPNANEDTTNTESTTTKSSSYPIWPMRLFQIEMCCIYAGAGYGKLATEKWRSGNALYHVRTNH